VPIPTSIEEWLKGINMEKYFKTFMEHNCDALDMLQYLDEKDLNDMDIRNPHKKKLLLKTKELSTRLC
jgi:SAM domain (Sterile alpha motif)